MNPTDIAHPDYFHKVVDCQWACPAHTPVPEYIRLIAAGRYGDAYMVNWESNVFPGILGRTCDRPCEPACRRGRVEEGSPDHRKASAKPEPVAICRLKRVAADYKGDIRARLPKRAAARNGKRVALIGAGPASLTVARDLAPLGYECVIFDGDRQGGGMMRTQIPKFRLPDSVIDEEVGYILDQDIEFHGGVRIDSMRALLDQKFDAVVDVSRHPGQVRRAVAALRRQTGHWTFVSTVSVYADNRTPGQRADTAQLRAPTAPEIDYSTEETYGAAKVACEQAVGESAFICRAGLIVGPEDPTGRFTYWPARLARGGEVLVPGTPEDTVQFIDVRDLAQWIVHAAQSGLTGIYDGIGPTRTRGELLAECAAALGSSCTFTWVNRAFLEEHDVNDTLEGNVMERCAVELNSLPDFTFIFPAPQVQLRPSHLAGIQV